MMSCISRQKKLPGPWGLPILGSLNSLKLYKERTLHDWQQYYGPIYKVPFGTTDVLILNGYEAIHDAFIGHDEVFNSRQKCEMLDHFRNGRGIFFAHDMNVHTTNRGFWINHYMANKDKIGAIINDETHNMIDYIKAQNGKPLNLETLINDTATNIILQLVFSKGYGYESKVIQDCLELTFRCIKNKKFALVSVLQFLSRLPPFQRFNQEIHDVQNQLHSILKKMTEERFSRKDIDDGCTDLAATFKSEYPDPTEEDKVWFCTMIEDLFFGGTKTLKVQVVWIVLELLRHPDMMRKAVKELETVFGDSRDYHDVEKHFECHFLRACVEEGMRLRTMAPTGTFHSTTQDINFKGYHIPKGMLVMFNLYSVHFETSFWGEDVDQFRPERHLNAESGKFQSTDHVKGFGFGRRSCGGAKMAMVEVMTFITGLLLNFDIAIHEPEKMAADGISEAIYQTPPFESCFTERVKVEKN